jgi:hypothetical protein
LITYKVLLSKTAKHHATTPEDAQRYQTRNKNDVLGFGSGYILLPKSLAGVKS